MQPQRFQNNKWTTPRLFLIGILATLAVTAGNGVYVASAQAVPNQTRTDISCTPKPNGAFGFDCNIVVTNVTSPTGQNPQGRVDFTSTGAGDIFVPAFCVLQDLDDEEAISGCEVVFRPLALALQRITATYRPQVPTTWAESSGETSVFTKPQTFPHLSCGSPVPIGQPTPCTFGISQVSNPNELLPSGRVTFKDSHDPKGVFSPTFCDLDPSHSVTTFETACSVTFSSTTAGGRTITAEYAGDAIHDATSASTQVKVFVPQLPRFAAPGGDGAEPCTDKRHPCTLFTAADIRAPGTSITQGAEVVLAPGTYEAADIGPFGAINLEKNITLHGEDGEPRPRLKLGNGSLSSDGGTLRYVEVESSGSLAIENQRGVLDGIIARTTGANAIACRVGSGTLRNSACLSIGTGSSAVGFTGFTESSDALEEKLRNVTAISTGSGSSGLRFGMISGVRQTPGSFTISAKSVIARGAKADVVAEGIQVESTAPAGRVDVVLDHSDYATIETKAESGGSATITPAGDAVHFNITADPKLAADNVHETAASPTIEKGEDDGFTGTTDVDGEARRQGPLQGPQVDIGADEFFPPNATKTEFHCQAASLVTGESTQCTATVVDLGDIHGVTPPTGQVSFKDNTQPGAFPSQASCQLKASPLRSDEASCESEVTFHPTDVGTHALEATYPGDNGPHAESHFTLSFEVKPKRNDTRTELTCQPVPLQVNHTAQCNARVIDRANRVAASSPTGMVSFKDNTEAGAFPASASCQLHATGEDNNEGRCEVEVSFHPTVAGSHGLEAVYPGDNNHTESKGQLSVAVEPGPNETETELTCREPSPISGQTTHCTATVTEKINSPPTPLAGGVISFEDAAEGAAFPPPANCTLVTLNAVQASCEVDYRPTRVGPHTLKASYPGDGLRHLGSFKTISIQVRPQPNETRTEMSCQDTSLNINGTTHCTAKVTDKGTPNGVKTPTGQVSFEDSIEPGAFPPQASCHLHAIGTDNNEAGCEAQVDFHPTTVVGSHTLEATYAGDDAHAESSGQRSVLVKVEPNATKTELTCKALTLNAGETTQCTATVTDRANKGPATTLAGDVVSFKDNTEIGAFPQPDPKCVLVDVPGSNQATCAAEVPLSPNVIATHALEASYPGRTDAHEPSKGNLSVRVKAQANATATAVSCKAVTMIAGQTTQCTATVTDEINHTAASPPTGVVTFRDNSELRGIPLPGTCTLHAVGTENTEASCQAEVEFKPTTPIDHEIEAIYPGDEKHVGSAKTLTVSVKNPDEINDTKTELHCQTLPLVVNTVSHCTVVVTDQGNNVGLTPPVGEVSFVDKTERTAFADPAKCILRPVGQGISEGGCEAPLEFAPKLIGNHSLEASYSGDDDHVASNGKLVVNVQPLAGPPKPGNLPPPGGNPSPNPPPSGGTPPNTILRKKPRAKTTARVAVFGFASDQPGAAFQCKVDRKPAKPCRSPFKVKKLKLGRHTFTVKAVNAQGIADPTPVVFRWKVGK